tara:strand:- start:8 stop:568 length:561 start_codon:yes stop_codon:yes gene_type:complete
MARRKILRTLRGNKKARKRLKKAMGDRKVTRRELKKVVAAGGVTEKQALKIRKRLRKSNKFETPLSKKKVRSLFSKKDTSDSRPDPPEYLFDFEKPGPINDDFNFNIDFGDQFESLQRTQEDYQNQMTDMFSQMNIGAIDPVERQRIQGIRFADRGTGGQTRRQLARRGTSGVFGRGGLRISSLNI